MTMLKALPRNVSILHPYVALERSAPPVSPLSELTITHNFRELRERPKRQVVDNKKGVADNML
jgi:hypothetical protein